MKVISVYNNFANTGGAQDMALRIAQSFSGEDQPVILTRTPRDIIHPSYSGRAAFMKLTRKNVRAIVRKWPDAVFLSHDRKSTTRLMLYRFAGLRRLRVVHVAHNVFDNLRLFTLFPKRVIAISRAVEANLRDFFHVPEPHITYIPNGLPDRGERSPRTGEGIKILHMGRICKVKRQIELATALDGYMPEGTELYFAGCGELQDELQSTVAEKKHMHYIGQIDPSEAIAEYDYVLLFSEREGLPLSLIESCMFGRPMITNALPSVLEINRHGETGYVCSGINVLRDTIKNLPAPGSAEYSSMAKNARLRYESSFTEPAMLEAYRRVLLSQDD